MGWALHLIGAGVWCFVRIEVFLNCLDHKALEVPRLWRAIAYLRVDDGPKTVAEKVGFWQLTPAVQ